MQVKRHLGLSSSWCFNQKRPDSFFIHAFMPLVSPRSKEGKATERLKRDSTSSQRLQRNSSVIILNLLLLKPHSTFHIQPDSS